MSQTIPPDSAARPDRVEVEFRSASLAVVSLVGEHDLARYEPLKEALAAAVGRRRNVFVDLSDCTFIDSTVISLLLHAQDEVVPDGGAFALIVPGTSIHLVRVIDVMCLGQALPIFSSIAEATATTGTPLGSTDISAARREPARGENPPRPV